MIRVGISACLLGDQVRYDGGHQRDSGLIAALAPLVEWVKVCPEVEVGMGTPREPVRLIESGGRVRMVTVTTGVDYTEAMSGYVAQRLDELAAAGLCGYVLKADSPSCGPAGVKLYRDGPAPARTGVGLFARALLDRFPDLPIEDEARLADPRIRDRFVERLFAYRAGLQISKK
jgi:uncharacterized protein YbbK (DUF523 family)